MWSIGLIDHRQKWTKFDERDDSVAFIAEYLFVPCRGSFITYYMYLQLASHFTWMVNHCSVPHAVNTRHKICKILEFIFVSGLPVKRFRCTCIVQWLVNSAGVCYLRNTNFHLAGWPTHRHIRFEHIWIRRICRVCDERRAKSFLFHFSHTTVLNWRLKWCRLKWCRMKQIFSFEFRSAAFIVWPDDFNYVRWNCIRSAIPTDNWSLLTWTLHC